MNQWPIYPLGEIASCLDGQRIPIKADDRVKRIGSVPYYGANGQVGWIDEALFDEPLLLIAEDGGHFDEPHKGVAYAIRGPSWVNNHAHVLRPDREKVMLEFLDYYFRHFDFAPYITGTTRAKLTQSDLMRVRVPVPILDQQKRIVKLLSEADALRKLRAEADCRAADLIPALFHEMFGDPSMNLKGWPTKQLADVILRTEQRDPRECPDREFRYVDIASVDNESKKIASAKRIVGANAPSRARKIMRKGDVIVSMVRPNLNAVALVPVDLDHEVCSTGFSVLRPSEKLASDYLFAFVCLPFFARHLVSKTTGANYPAVSDRDVKESPIPVPPLSVQKQFAARVAEIRAMQAAQAESKRRLDDMFQSMLLRAFAGEL